MRERDRGGERERKKRPTGKQGKTKKMSGWLGAYEKREFGTRAK